MSWRGDEPYSTLIEDSSTFEQLLQSKMVLLEKCQLECEKDDHAIKGVAAVMNMDQMKNIFVRYTRDSWNSFTDATAEYVSSHFTSDGTAFDLFKFELPFSIAEGDDETKKSEWSCSMEFAIAYQVHNIENWDNNDGSNYQLHLNHENCGMY